MGNDQKIDTQPSQHLLWWQTGVIYQIYPRSYALNFSGEEQQVSMPALGADLSVWRQLPDAMPAFAAYRAAREWIAAQPLTPRQVVLPVKPVVAGTGVGLTDGGQAHVYCALVWNRSQHPGAGSCDF